MSRTRLRERAPLFPALTAALAAAGILVPSAQAQIQSAGTLFVNVDATQAAVGPLANIANSGTLGGVFEAVGGGNVVPTVAQVGSAKAIVFDGSDFLQHRASVGGDAVIAPFELTGDSPTRSIEVWAMNPELAAEETLVSWGHRGGPDGSNMSFNYGSEFRWGAVGHWGNADVGWNNNGGGPTPNQWHHLVYTFDGEMVKLYSDGVLVGGEFLGAGRILTHADTAIVIGGQSELNGEGLPVVTGGLRFTGAIAKVRVHDEALTAAQVLNNYNFEKATFAQNPPAVNPPAPTQPERLTKGPIHRYSFSEAAAANAEGMEFRDSVGTAHGTVLGAGGAFTGTRMTLPGGSSQTQAYGDLPNGLLSSHSTNNGGSGQFTFETWIKVTGSRQWSRVFDFGSTTLSDGTYGELEGAGGGGEGRDYFQLSAQVDGNTGARRLEVRNEDPAGGGAVSADFNTPSFNQDVHVVVTWDEAAGRIRLFDNGQPNGEITVDEALSDINDVNVWLGRSNWTGDQNVQAEYDEVRIYDYLLTPGQVLGNSSAGPNIINNTGTPVTISAQPQNATSVVGYGATFRVTATGSAPISYQWLRNGNPIANATNATFSLSNLSTSDSGAQLSVRVSNNVEGQPVSVTSSVATLTVQEDANTLKHRYSFNEATGTQATDSVGSAHGTLMGQAVLGEGQVALDGISDTYVDLPNGIVSALGANGTFEMWITPDFNQNWSRVFDFGVSTDGEDLAANGLDYLFFTPRRDIGYPQFTANFPDGGDVSSLVHPGSAIPGTEEHIVITWNATANTSRMYTNGVLVATSTAPRPLSALAGADVNNWLGRSQFIADAGYTGKYNEFRIYSGSLTPEQVAASYASGPNALPVALPRLSAQLSGNNLVVSWPSSATGFTLEGTPSLTNPTWTSLGAGTSANGQQTVTIPLTGNAQFVRLRR